MTYLTLTHLTLTAREVLMMDNTDLLPLFEVKASPDATLVGRRVRAATRGQARTLLVKLLGSSLPFDPVLKVPRLPTGTVVEQVEAGKLPTGGVVSEKE